MLLIYILYCTLTLRLSVQAIIISVDRADDVKSRPAGPSMIENGWQPLTGYESTGNNVSPSSNVPHFTLGEPQGHLIAAERAKVQQKNKSYNYGPPAVDHAAAKSRGRPKDHTKQVALETREYSFLIPPPREAFRFKVEPQRREILNSDEPFLRQSALITQHHPSPSFSSTNRPPIFFENKPSPPPTNGVGVRQALQPPKYQAQIFEFQKDSNTRSFLQPPGAEVAVQFGKDNPDTRNSFKHHSPYRISFERDPGFLVHESHEVSYVTPSTFGFNVRPTSPSYDNFFSRNVYSTVAPGTDLNKYLRPPANNVPNVMFNQFEAIGKFPKHTVQSGSLLSGDNAGTYFVPKYHDVLPPSAASYISNTKFTTEINEVLPKNVPPIKFRQEPANSNSVVQLPQRIPEIVSPVVLQRHRSPVVTAQRQTPELQYETPETISLKHFNEQQFLLQQQLIQRDKDKLRLQELELQRQQETERQQNEALARQQTDLRVHEQQQQQQQQRQRQQQKEAELKKIEEERRWQQLRNQLEHEKNLRDEQYAMQEQKELEQQHSIQQQHIDITMHVHEQDTYKHRQQPQTPQDITIRNNNNFTELEEQQQPDISDEVKSEILLRNSKKPLYGKYRGQRPTTPIYNVQPMEFPTQDTKTYPTFEEVATETIALDEEPFSTTTVRPRIRRPGLHRRRRPIAITLEPQTVTSSPSGEEAFVEYEKSQVDFTERVQAEPTESTYKISAKRRPVIRKRPGHGTRIHLGEPFEAEVVTEVVDPSNIASTNATRREHYKDSLKKEVDSSLPTTQENSARGTEEDLTEGVPEIVHSEKNGMTEEQTPVESLYGDRIKLQDTSSPFENLFNESKESDDDFDTTTVPSTTSSTVAPITTSEVSIATTRPSHRIRPLRFGNVTRPRFSIKNYKSRVDYKNRLTHISTTEASHTSPQSKTRFSTISRPQEAFGNAVGGTTGRYRYMSRVSYKTTTSLPPLNRKQTDDNVTTETANRFVPKRKSTNGHLYRSRIITDAKDYSNKSESAVTRHDTVRADNIFSSSVRQRPHLKTKAKIPEEVTDDSGGQSEMTAEETSFYAAASTTPRLTEDVNEVIDEKEVGQSSGTEESVTAQENEKETTFTMEGQRESITEPFFEVEDKAQTVKNETEEKEGRESSSEVPDVRFASTRETESTIEAETWAMMHPHDKSLSDTVSQSVADLTSSASALYDKPGMFAAVSPVAKNRVISPRLKISTDEPTLPIEAFFQELSKKE